VVAPLFGAGQLEVVAQGVEQRGAGVEVDVVLAAVDVQGHRQRRGERGTEGHVPAVPAALAGAPVVGR